MADAYIVATYQSLKKPFSIIGRQSHCGGTDKWTIAFIDEDDARLLVENGMSWRWGQEPDWAEHYNKMKRLNLEATIRKAEKELAEATS